MERPSFPERFARSRATFGPLVFGLDPSDAILSSWDLPADADGLERFVDVALQAVTGTVGVLKAQSAFFERHGWKGVRALSRLVAAAREAGLLVILDAKRGDVGSTNGAYAAAYLGEGAALPVDAMTVTPYLGIEAMGPFFGAALAAGAGLFVVSRSSNPEGRAIQEAVQADGRSVERAVLEALGEHNRRAAAGIPGGGLGPFGAVLGPTHALPVDLDLAGMGGLFLAPGLGTQGAGPADIARCFAACPERVLPSASRALLASGPSVGRLRDAAQELNRTLLEALDHPRP